MSQADTPVLIRTSPSDPKIRMKKAQCGLDSSCSVEYEQAFRGPAGGGPAEDVEDLVRFNTACGQQKRTDSCDDVRRHGGTAQLAEFRFAVRRDVDQGVDIYARSRQIDSNSVIREGG
jgi:hypothetical protein